MKKIYIVGLLLFISVHYVSAQNCNPPGDLSDQITGPSVVESGKTYNFTLPAIPGLSYSWVADGGNVVGGWNSNSVQIRFGSINGYVKVTVKNSCGTGPVARKAFTIDPVSCKPPDWIDGNPNGLCGGKVAHFIATKSWGATSYKWTVPPGFTILSGQGTQYVAVKVPNHFTSGLLEVAAVGVCGTSPTTGILLTGAPGDLSALIEGPQSVVKGTTNNYSMPFVQGQSYSWVADGGNVVGGWNTNSVSIRAGNISGDVKVTVKNACGTGPLARKSFAIVPDCQLPQLSYTWKDNGICEDAAEGALSAITIGGTGPFTYEWKGPDGFTSTSKDISGLKTGRYHLTVRTIEGCSVDEFAYIGPMYWIDQPPGPIEGQKHTLCYGKVATYTATEVPGATAYHWLVDSGFTILSGQGTRSVTVKAPAKFTTAVLKVSANAPCGNTGYREVELSGAPNFDWMEMEGPAEVVTGSVYNYTFPAVPGLSYSWVADGGFVVGGWGSNSVSILAGRTAGLIKMTGTNACGSAEAYKFYSLVAATGANSILANDNQPNMSTSLFRVYPNPVQGQATVEFESPDNTKYELKIVDMFGRILVAKRGTAFAGINTVQLPLSGYSKGIYLVNLTSKGKVRTIKLLKSN